MIAIVFILCILVVALIVRDIIMQIKFNDLKGSHNVLTGKVKDCEALIDAQRLPDKDKTAMISAILDLRYPRKYPNGHTFISEDGDTGYITDTYVAWDAANPFDTGSHIRYYYYFRPAIFSWPSRERLIVSESYLDTIAKVREQTLKECERKNPKCKKKGGSKS